MLGDISMKKTLLRLVPGFAMDVVKRVRYRQRPLPNAAAYQRLLGGGSGIEIGGPSAVFATTLPVYPVIAGLDGVNFSNRTLWEGAIDEGWTFNYHEQRMGRQFIAEATDLRGISDDAYDFLLSSNCLEHVANPLKALDEWKRVVKPGGHLLLVLPNKQYNFDHQRPVTAFSHLVDDQARGVTEHDTTHVDEIVRLHDLTRDPLAGDRDRFKARCLDNFTNRGLHHHVFDLPLMAQMLSHCGIRTLLKNATVMNFYALGVVSK